MNRAEKRRQKKLAAKAAKKEGGSSQALNMAKQHHAAGQFPQAESIYKKILETNPNQPDALHLLGVLSHQVGKADIAVDLIGKAIVAKPDFPEAHNNLGNARMDLGRIEEAVDSYRAALDINPGYAMAHYNLGNALKDLMRLEEAISSYKNGLEIQPDYPEIHHNLGNVLYDLGRLEEAVVSFQKAIAVRFNFTDAHFSLGNAFQDMGRVEEAIASYQKAIAFDPNFAEAHNNLGNSLLNLHRPVEAEASYLKAIAIKPDFAESLNNLGNALNDQKRFDEAMAYFRKARDINPDYAEAHFNIGFGLKRQDKLDEAIESYRKAVSSNPDFADGFKNLGVALSECGLQDEAISCFEKVCEIDPESAGAYSNVLLSEQYQLGHNARSLHELHSKWDERYGRQFRAFWPEHKNTPEPERRLRLGFVSSDLGRHPVGYFVVRLLENLSKNEVETIAYSERKPDDLTERIKAATDIWREIQGKTDDELISTISDDEIDILIDLAGHTGSRLLVFANKPAPVQVAWAGYVSTTGVSAIDYLLSDIYSTPKDEEEFYNEDVIRMPNGWLCYDPPAYAPDVGSLPMKNDGTITFASFSNPAKINKEVVSVWARILAGVANSSLLIKCKGGNSRTFRDRLTMMFEALGVDRSRLMIEGRSPHAELLARYNDVDIALDPFPYSGGLTTYEALWMGVPVITVPGETFASRHTLSHLQALGLPELVACDQDNYVEIAIGLAKDSDRLDGLRAGLRGRMANSPLCDGKLFAEGFLVNMREIWRNWCVSKK